MEIRISISIDDTLRRIYALSALRTYMNSQEREVPMLTPDNRLALAGLVGDAFSQLALGLMPHVVACQLPEEGKGDLLSMDLAVDGEMSPAVPALRRAIENVLSDSVMGALFADSDSSLSRQFLESAQRGIDGIKAGFSVGIQPATVRGHR